MYFIWLLLSNVEISQAITISGSYKLETANNICPRFTNIIHNSQNILTSTPNSPRRNIPNDNFSAPRLVHVNPPPLNARTIINVFAFRAVRFPRPQISTVDLSRVTNFCGHRNSRILTSFVHKNSQKFLS